MSRLVRLHFLILFIAFTAAQPIELNFDINQTDNNTLDTDTQQHSEASICENVWCINDAHLLLGVSANADPCANDLDEAVEPPRDQKFLRLARDIYRERLRKIFAARYDETRDDGRRVAKVAKNAFRQCFNALHPSRHVQAQHDILRHLRGLTGSPLVHALLNETDDEVNIDTRILFEIEGDHALRLFFDLEVGRCDEIEEIVCLKRPTSRRIFIESEDTEAQVMAELMPEANSDADTALERKRFFFVYREFIQSEMQSEEMTRVKIGKLSEKFPLHFGVDWLSLVNGELLEASQLTEDDEILIEGGIEAMQHIVFFMLSEMTIVADTFALTFLDAHRQDLSLNLLASEVSSPSDRRWSSCISRLHQPLLNPAVILMYEQWRPVWEQMPNESIDVAASMEEFALAAVDAFKSWFIERKADMVPATIGVDVLNKLKNIEIVASVQEKTMSIERLDEFYEELFLEGDENYLRSVWEMRRFKRKVANEPSGRWRREIDAMVSGDALKYDIEGGNVLYIPPQMLLYPWYHPQRPRFFNMATMFTETIRQLSLGVERHIKAVSRKFLLEESYQHPHEIQLTYESYKNWLRTNNETKISVSSGKSLQLYWLAHAAGMHQRSGLESEGSDYFAYCRSYSGFKDAFLCSEGVTESEETTENFISV